MTRNSLVWRAVFMCACLLFSATASALAQTPKFILANAPETHRGRLNDNRLGETGREKRFVDARGWSHVLVPAGTTIDEQRSTSADLRWREGAHEVACTLIFSDTPPVGLDFAALQNLAAEPHSPHIEGGVLPPGVTVRERRMLTLGPERVGDAKSPRAAAWRFQSTAGLAMGMAYVSGVHGVMSMLCFRQDGGDPLATITERWRIARGFAE